MAQTHQWAYMYVCVKPIHVILQKNFKGFFKLKNIGPYKRVQTPCQQSSFPSAPRAKLCSLNPLDRQANSCCPRPEVLNEKVVGRKKIRKVYITSLQLTDVNYFSDPTVACFSTLHFSLRCNCVILRYWKSSILAVQICA